MPQKLVVVVGVGALGSHLVQFLRTEDVIFRVIDYDKVELKNLSSQFFSKNVNGSSKTQALNKLLKFLWGKSLDTMQVRLHENNADRLLSGLRGRLPVSLVIDCLDNGASRRVVQKVVRDRGIPCLHGALAPDGLLGRVVWDEDFRIDDEGDGAAATCENGDHLPFIALTSAYMARSAQEFLRSGKKLGFEVYPRSPSTRI